jgi:hypothetical protein
MSEFNTIASLLGVYTQTNLEKKLIKTLGGDIIAPDITQRFAAQWSQLVAWSWLEPEDYGTEERPSDEQEALRKAFIATVKELGRYCIAEHYCPGMFGKNIKDQSDLLSQYLTGELSEGDLTLPKLYKQLTGKDDYTFKPEFTQHFIWVVTVDRFNGWLAGYNETEDKFVMVLAYPPRPALSPSVLQASDLRQWSQGKGDGDYTPPNPYIPTCIC